MLFLELAAQAVRGFSPSIRVALKPGYSALKSPGDLPSPLSGLIVALTFPDGRGGDAAFLAPGAKAGRAGLSIQGNDGSIWRVVRDLGGAGGLHKLNRANNQFEPIATEASDMAQSLRSGAGFPARTTWEQLFTINGPQLPTRRPRAAAPSGAFASSPSGSFKNLPRVQNQWEGGGGGAAVSAEDLAKLPALEAELVTARKTTEVQFKLDGVTAELYNLETRKQKVEEVTGRLKAARAEAADLKKKFEGLPPDIEARMRRVEDDQKQYKDTLARYREEEIEVKARAASAPDSLLKDQRFALALVAGLGLIIGADFLEGGMRLVALLGMVPLTLAALLALRYVEELQRYSRGKGADEVLAAREKKLTDEFQMSQTMVDHAIDRLGVNSPEEFLALAAKAAQFQNQLGALELEEADVRSDPEFIGVAESYARLKAEQEALNAELQAMPGGFVREVREIEREIQRIKEPAPPVKSSVSSVGFAPVATAPTESWEDPMPPLLMIATDLFATDVPSLWSVLHDRASQYITALTDRRYHAMTVDANGRATIEAPGRTIPARELPGKDLDLIYLALRLTLIEKAAPANKLPVVIEDTFNTVIDGPRQPLFGRMVKHLGSLTQVLHVSGAGHNGSMADTPVAI